VKSRKDVSLASPSGFQTERLFALFMYYC